VIGNLVAMAGAVVADALRRKVVYVALLFAAILSVMIPQLPTWGLGVIGAVFREVSLTLIFVVSLVLTLSLSANRIPAEVERRTVYNILSKRVHRWEYVVGTWLGVALVMLGAVVVFTAVAQLVGFWRYGAWMWLLWEGALAIWFEMCVVSAFAIAISVVSGPVVVVVSTLTFLFMAHSRDLLFGEAGAILALRRFYPSLDTFNVITPVAHGGGYSLAYAGSMTLALVGWCGLLLLLAAVLFGRRDV
jgi:ABC-type transport system involved in multi-copper enzyme maturation permease subunit